MTEEWKNQGVLDAYVEDFRERFNNKPYVARPSTLPLELYYDVYVGRKAKEYIEHVADHQPWFCQVGFSGPHEPWDAPEPYASLYDPATMPRPIVREMFQDDDSRPRGNLDKLMTEKNDHSPPVTLDEIAQMRANYAGNVTLIDEQIGGIIQALKDRGEYDRTVIVFVSDHGEMNGDYGLIYKENFFNGAVKVPLIISTPEIRANRDLRGTVSDTMVELFDLGPTFCDIAGGTIAHQQFGQSLQRHLQDPLQVHRLDAMSQHKGEVMLATQNYKIVFNQQGEPYLFFDVSKDPQELCNRIGDPQYEEVIAHFQQRLGQRLISSQKYLQFDRPDTAGIEHLVGKK
jgi:choline-sulfatase